jgi:hypothetical protein
LIFGKDKIVFCYFTEKDKSRKNAAMLPPLSISLIITLVYAVAAKLKCRHWWQQNAVSGAKRHKKAR